MDLTYIVRGADGKEYGPATLEQITGWAREGRVQPQQQVKRSDMDQWAAAVNFSELQAAFPSTANVTPPNLTATEAPAGDPATEAQMRSGASWFYWIAGLSLINSISAFSDSSWRFLFGLGITDKFVELADEMGSGGKGIALGLNLVAAGVFVLFGIFAHKRHTWAFVTGMALFALDGVIFLLAQDWLGVGLHAFALYCLFRGFKACRELSAA